MADGFYHRLKNVEPFIEGEVGVFSQEYMQWLGIIERFKDNGWAKWSVSNVGPVTQDAWVLT